MLLKSLAIISKLTLLQGVRHTVLYMCLKSPNSHRIFAGHNLEVILAQNFKTIEKKCFQALSSGFCFW